MEDVDPSKGARVFGIFRTVTQNIDKRLSASQSATANGPWKKWSEFCPDVYLDPLLVLYRCPVSILDTFVRQYRTGALAPSICQVQSLTVEDNVRLIGQALTAMGGPEPRLTIQGKLDIRI